MEPRGATELQFELLEKHVPKDLLDQVQISAELRPELCRYQFELLEKHVPKDLLDQVQICTSIPGKVPIDPNKLNILWQKNSYDQSNLYHWFADPDNHKQYDWYVFNSHWNYEKFRYFFRIPTEKCVVIKNGINNFPKRKIYKEGEPNSGWIHCSYSSNHNRNQCLYATRGEDGKTKYTPWV